MAIVMKSSTMGKIIMLLKVLLLVVVWLLIVVLIYYCRYGNLWFEMLRAFRFLLLNISAALYSH